MTTLHVPGVPTDRHGQRAPWSLVVLARHSRGVFETGYVHGTVLTDRPALRSFLRQLQRQALARWRAQYGAADPGRYRLHLESAPRMRHGAEVTVIYLGTTPDGRDVPQWP